jgi:hypothetical protein
VVASVAVRGRKAKSLFVRRKRMAEAVVLTKIHPAATPKTM